MLNKLKKINHKNITRTTIACTISAILSALTVWQVGILSSVGVLGVGVLFGILFSLNNMPNLTRKFLFSALSAGIYYLAILVCIKSAPETGVLFPTPKVSELNGILAGAFGAFMLMLALRIISETNFEIIKNGMVITILGGLTGGLFIFLIKPAVSLSNWKHVLQIMLAYLVWQVPVGASLSVIGEKSHTSTSPNPVPDEREQF